MFGDVPKSSSWRVDYLVDYSADSPVDFLVDFLVDAGGRLSPVDKQDSHSAKTHAG